MRNKGQVTIFIVLAILIVGGIVGYFLLRDSFVKTVPEEMRPVYDYYVSCLEDTTDTGIALLGEQGGRIDVGDFVPGSAYMPFSSQLDFMGQGVPYWMYVSGNNVLKENVPEKVDMEKELGNYISERVTSCDFSDFKKQGFDVYVEEGDASVEINDLDVAVDVENKITIFKGESSAVVSSHKFSVKSKLGKFYTLARKVYDYEKTNMFLEKYALDVLRLYAPVDGVKMSCSPIFFVDSEIRKALSNALVANILSIKLDGDYYDLSSNNSDYFVVDAGLNVDENVNFMYSSSWPTRIEIYGDRIAKPVGTQPGLSALGFCYVPYHLVYDMDFPVMIQFFDNEELFQFPVSVIIDKNQARKAMKPTFNELALGGEVCRYKNSDILVYTYDTNLNPVEARLQFKCLDSVCEVGETKLVDGDAVYDGGISKCVNGFIIASADGYADTKYQISTNEENVANIVMKKKYNIGLDLGDISGTAIVNFVSDDYSAMVAYPEMKNVTLIEGQYNISVYVYRNSTLKIKGYNKKVCVNAPADGVSGLLGIEDEKCYNMNVPDMDVDMAVIGGGSASEYIAESSLEDYNKLNLNVPLFGAPSSVEELQKNYVKAEESDVYLDYE